MALNNEIVNIKIRANKFDLMRKSLWRKRQEIKESIRKAKVIVDNAIYVEKVLLDTKERINRDTIDGYSKFLTSMFHAVFPELQEQKYIKVVMEGTGQRQKLGFYVVDIDGNVEDVFQGNGGALTNVISTGLRIISVYRSSALKKVLFLDEQDCWISPDRASYYYNALSKISEVFSMQIIAVSHHDASIFSETGARLIPLSSSGGEILEDSEKGWIEKIELENFRVHKKLSVSFSSGMNILYGKNNTGKSTVLNALYSVFAGGSDDSVISHGEEKAKVKVFFSNAEHVEFIRQKKTPKTYYRIYNAQGDVIDEGKDLQLLISDRYGLGADEDILSQFGMQKEPVFLLNAPGSKMIKSMSIGNETEWVDKILEKWRTKVRSARSAIRVLDEQYENIEQAKKAISDYSRNIKRRIRKLENLNKALADNEANFDKLKSIGQRYGNLIKVVEGLKNVKALEERVLHIGNLKDDLSEKIEKTNALYKLIDNYQSNISRLDRVVKVKENVNVNNIKNEIPSKLKSVEQTLKNIENIQGHLDSVVKIGKELKSLEEKAKDIVVQMEKNRQELKLIEDEKSVIFESMGGVCPCCNQVVHIM